MIIAKKFNFTSTSILPIGYTAVNFVDTNMMPTGSTGNPIGAFVKTDIRNLVAAKVNIYAQAYIKSFTGGWNFLVGAEQTDNETGNIKIRLYGVPENGFNLTTHVSDDKRIEFSPNTVLDIEYHNTYFKVNDSICNFTTTPSSVVNSNYLFIGAAQTTLSQNDGYKRVWPGLIGQVKIVQDNVILGDFYPCVRKQDKKVGFYDMVTKQFYSSSNSRTEFTVGVI